MKKTLLIGLTVLAMTGGGVALALGNSAQDRPAATASAQRQTTFAVENMTCATCPITVRKAMKGVAGVTAVNVDFAAKTRSEEHTSELQSLMRISYADFYLKKKKYTTPQY